MGIVSSITSIFIRLVNAACNRHHFSVLNYHRVMPSNGQECTQALDPLIFEQQLIWLKKLFRVLSLQDALKLAKENRLPRNVVVITIDDGFKDCFNYVFPLLQKHELTATFFITTSGLKNGYLWESQISQCFTYLNPNIRQITLGKKTFDWTDSNSQNNAIQRMTELIKYQPLIQRQQLLDELSKQLNSSIDHLDTFLTPAELKQMYKAGMTIGAHTVNHPILNLEKPEIAFNEIAYSKEELEKIIGAPIHFFAYPNGKFEVDFTSEHVQMVKDLNFQAAFSTEWGLVDFNNDNPFLLKRFTPWDQDPSRFCLRLALSAISEQRGFGWLKQFVRQDNSLYSFPENTTVVANERI